MDWVNPHFTRETWTPKSSEKCVHAQMYMQNIYCSPPQSEVRDKESSEMYQT